MLLEFHRDPDADPLEQSLRFWHAVTDASLIYGPLFFELSGHAMQGQPHAGGLRANLVTAWLEPLALGWIEQGLAPGAARARARLDLAVARGLLFGLLITGDRAAVDEAMLAYARAVGAGHLVPGPVRR